ncbi:MAG: hypothetical protein Kow0047_14020 [Anaerolineae bacterium]
MRIALPGTRGVPASYSGFETCAEKLGSRLAARGHEVTVYCRPHHVTYRGDTYRGMRLVRLPTIANKHLDTIVHSFLSSCHALTQGYDVCLYLLVEAFQGLDTDMRCVIVGDAPYAEGYKAYLRELATRDPRVVLTGYQFGQAYHELGSNAYVFVETSGVGGTHPAVLEAMAFGRCVVVNDTPENLETIGDAGLSYSGARGASALREVLMTLVRDPSLVTEYGERAAARVARHYSWDAVTDQYEALFRSLL